MQVAAAAAGSELGQISGAISLPPQSSPPQRFPAKLTLLTQWPMEIEGISRGNFIFDNSLTQSLRRTISLSSSSSLVSAVSETASQHF